MLKIKFWRIENVIVMKILEQGDEIKRGDFKFKASNGIKFDSGYGPMLEFGHTIWVRGKVKELDEDVAACACLNQEYARHMLKSYIEAVREYNNSLQQSVEKDVIGTVENIRAVIVG